MTNLYNLETNDSSLVKIPSNFIISSEDEYQALLLLNDDLSKYQLRVDKPNIKVYYKYEKCLDSNKNERELAKHYTIATFNYSADKLYKSLCDYQTRIKYDDFYSNGKLINETQISENIIMQKLYLYLKLSFFMSDRDFVVSKKIYKNYFNKKDCYLIYIKSIEEESVPEVYRVVRGEFINRSAFIEPIDENKCKIYLENYMDMRLAIGNSLMGTQGSDGQCEWVEKVNKFMEENY